MACEFRQRPCAGECLCLADETKTDIQEKSASGNCPKGFYDKPDRRGVENSKATEAENDKHLSEALAVLPQPLGQKVTLWLADKIGLTESIGRAIWEFWHTRTLLELSADERQSDLEKFERWIKLLKFCGCSDKWKLIKQFFPPPPFTASSDDWFRRGVDWHNAVNRHRGLPNTSYGAAFRQWRGLPRKVIISQITGPNSSLAPGDCVMATALARDIKLAFPAWFVDIHGCCAEIFRKENPRLSAMKAEDSEAETIQLIWRGESTGGHWSQDATGQAERILRVKIPRTADHGELFLAKDQKPHPADGEPYWVLVAGGKQSCTVKIPDMRMIQEVINRTPKIRWVRIGNANGNDGGDTHIHPPLRGLNLIDFIGKTDWRRVVHLIAHAQGVLCGITAAMHIAAAFGVPAVVVAGGRESEKWIGGEGITLLSTVGQLDCCKTGGCWKSLTVPLDGGSDMNSLCKLSVIRSDGAVPRCQEMITADQVVAALESVRARQ